MGVDRVGVMVIVVMCMERACQFEGAVLRGTQPFHMMVVAFLGCTNFGLEA